MKSRYTSRMEMSSPTNSCPPFRQCASVCSLHQHDSDTPRRARSVRGRAPAIFLDGPLRRLHGDWQLRHHQDHLQGQRWAPHSGRKRFHLYLQRIRRRLPPLDNLHHCDLLAYHWSANEANLARSSGNWHSTQAPTPDRDSAIHSW